MIIIQRDPGGISGFEKHVWNHDVCMFDNLRLCLDSGGDIDRIFLNGVQVELDGDWNLAYPVENDELIIQLRPAAANLLIYAIVALVAAAAVYYLTPKPNTDTNSTKDSPNNQLTGQSNITRTYQARPSIYGRVRAYPDLIQQTTFEYISNVKYLTETMYISDGIGTVEEIKFADTLIADYAGATYELFYPPESSTVYPEDAQTTLTDVVESFASPEVNGQTLTPVTTWATVTTTPTTLVWPSSPDTMTITWPESSAFDQLKSIAGTGTARILGTVTTSSSSYSYDFTGDVISFTTDTVNVTFVFEAASRPGNFTSFSFTSVKPSGTTITTLGPYVLPQQSNKIRCNFVFLRGLRGTVNIDIFWEELTAGGVPTGTSATIPISYSGNTYSQQFRTYDFSPSAGNSYYRVSFSRTNTAQTSDNTDQCQLEGLFSLNYYATKTIPGGTVVRVTVQATESATGGTERKFNCIFTRHVRLVTSADKLVTESRSFADAINHEYLVYGNGIASQLDILQLILLKAGIILEDEELGYFDYTMDDVDLSLGESLALIANACRVTVTREGLQWTFVRDQKKSGLPRIHFDYRNLASDGDSQVQISGFMPGGKDGVEIYWVNPDSDTKESIFRSITTDGLITEDEPSNPVRTDYPFRSLVQANNRADYEARRLLYQRQFISDTALSDANTLSIGDLVRWLDPNDFGVTDASAGEVIGIDGLNIETSEPVVLDTAGRVVFTGVTGEIAQPVQCVPRTDGKNGFTLLSLPTNTIYVANGTTRQLGSRYLIIQDVTADQFNASHLYLVTNKKPRADGKIDINLINYDERVYYGDIYSSGEVVTPFVSSDGNDVFIFAEAYGSIATASITFKSDGTIVYDSTNDPNLQTNWFSVPQTGVGAAFWIRRIGPNPDLSIDPGEEWIRLDVDRTFGNRSYPSSPSGKTGIVIFQIAQDSFGTNILATSPEVTIQSYFEPEED